MLTLSLVSGGNRNSCTSICTSPVWPPLLARCSAPWPSCKCEMQTMTSGQRQWIGYFLTSSTAFRSTISLVSSSRTISWWPSSQASRKQSRPPWRKVGRHMASKNTSYTQHTVRVIKQIYSNMCRSTSGSGTFTWHHMRTQRHSALHKSVGGIVEQTGSTQSVCRKCKSAQNPQVHPLGDRVCPWHSASVSNHLS